ncbi:50S ribosomal protein L15e [Candidatus Aenigmatarchaeota archaeon]
MSFNQRLKNTWRTSGMRKETIRTWRKQTVVKKISRPTRIDRAHALGYKAKQGFSLIRTRIKKGGRKRPHRTKGHKPSKSGHVSYTTKQSLQSIAEKRASRKFPNLEVLNSYYAAEDGQYKYYEVIFLDPKHPTIIKNKDTKWITRQTRRVYRGKTSAAKKSRNLGHHPKKRKKF